MFLYYLILIVTLSFSTIAHSNDVENKLSCDIDKVQTKDWSDDIAGYQQDNRKVLLPKWLSKAKSGDPKYQFYVGRAYDLNVSHDIDDIVDDQLPWDRAKAKYWFQESSKQQYAPAMAKLAHYYEWGIGESTENGWPLLKLNLAFNLMCQSAISGYSEAQYYMGKYYQNGLHDLDDIGVLNINNDLAISWYKIAAESQHVASFYQLGMLYAGGDSVQDTDLAIKFMKIAANSGYVIAYHWMGYFYKYGIGIEKDLEKSIIWYKKAANNGSFWGMYDLGMAYKNGSGVEINNEIAFNWLYKASKNIPISADPSILYVALGNSYWYGEGVKKDLSEAAFWFYKAAKLNDQFGIDGLGMVFIYMSDVEREKYPYINKELIFEEIVPNLSGYVLYEFGEKLWFGDGDKVNGLKLFKLAALKEDVDAQKRLGFLYSISVNKEVQINHERSEYWYKRAIENGDIEAIGLLGSLYFWEFGVLGVKNPLYDSKKGFELLQEAFIKAGDLSVYPALLFALSYAYEWGEGTSEDINKLIEVKKVMSRITKSSFKENRDNYLLEIFEIQANNNIAISDESKEALNKIEKKAHNGSTKSQLLLGQFYQNDITKKYDLNNAKHKDFDQAEYWLKKASNNSIEANILLSEMYITGNIGYISMEESAKAITRAIELFENSNPIDQDFFNNSRPDKLVKLYQQSARMFQQQGMNDIAEQMLRKASKIYLALDSYRPFESDRMIIMNQITSEGDIESSLIKTIAGKYVIPKDRFEAIINVAELYKNRGEYKGSITVLEDGIEILKHYDYQYKAVLLLLIADVHLDNNDNNQAMRYVELYSLYKEEHKTNKKNFFDSIESAMLNRIMGSIYLQNKDFKRGIKHIKIFTDSLLNLLAGIDSKNLMFGSKNIKVIANNGYYRDAFEIAAPLIDSYKKNYKHRIENNININKEERDLVKDIIATYIFAAQQSNNGLPGMGFEIMQLSSGLTASDAVIRATVKKKLDEQGSIYIDKLDILKVQKESLLDKKYSNYSEMSNLDTIKINNDLDELDIAINNVNNELKESKSRIDPINLFINSADDIQNVISAKDALLTMLISSDRTFVWLVTSDGVYSNNVAINSSYIKENVQDLLTSLDPKSGINRDFPFKASSALYDLLIMPFEKQLEGVDRLIIAPDPIVSKIPFSVLTYSSKSNLISNIGIFDNITTRGINNIHRPNSINNKVEIGEEYNWLIDKFAVSIIPSVHSYVELEKYKKTSQNNFNNFIGIGNPILNGTNKKVNKQQIIAYTDIRGSVSGSINELAQLPETEDELATIAKSFSDSYLLLGEDATEENLRGLSLNKYNIVSFATHALLSEEIENIVEPSLVLTPVDVSNPDNDGLLTASEIMQLKFDAEIVLLSACNTASSFGTSNTQALSGLANSFFYSGAKSLLVSYWSVISESAVDVTTRIFRPANRGRSYAHKHRNAVIDILKESAGTFKSHPSYWAPFSVIGVE